MSTLGPQMFAVGEVPSTLIISGHPCRLVRVFKHDFFAATCLYEPQDDGARVVVKFFRTQRFLRVEMSWAGDLMLRREQAMYRCLAGVPGIPRCLGRAGASGLVIEYVAGKPLDHLEGAPPAAFFDHLRKLFDEIHARGVGYCDANKRSNILIDDHSMPHLVDYQISVRRRDDWPRPFRSATAALVRYVQRSDLYHIYKHKRRLCPDHLTSEEDQLSRRRGWLHTMHRRMTDPWRLLRRSILRHLHLRGRLESPTASMEDHHQPEKATWRGD
jgi:hypothetical protein